jgi:hypothetical protein
MEGAGPLRARAATAQDRVLSRMGIPMSISYRASDRLNLGAIGVPGSRAPRAPGSDDTRSDETSWFGQAWRRTAPARDTSPRAGTELARADRRLQPAQVRVIAAALFKNSASKP